MPSYLCWEFKLIHYLSTNTVAELKVEESAIRRLIVVYNRPRDIAISVVGIGFNLRAGSIEHSVANDSPLLRCFFGAVLPRR